ncbi:MAG: hypothetical protein V3T31_10335 [candidate division Zixibacteria bacterium]
MQRIVAATKTLLLVAIGYATLSGCGGMSPTLFVHPEFNFGFLERVAVVPFENLTQEQGAGARISRFFIAELLATESFDVVEPGEVSRVLQDYGTLRTGDLTQQQIIDAGTALKVQGLFLGTINETSSLRSGSTTKHVVTITTRLVETETGSTVWSATHTEGSGSFAGSILGTGSKSQSEVMRRCIRNVLSTLVD